MKEYYLWLVRKYGPANHKIYDILEKYGSAENAFTELTKNKKNADIELDGVKRLLEQCEKTDISVITIADTEYPELLTKTYNPPALLFVQGDVSCLKNRCLTAVGTRKVTEYCARLCKRICGNIAEKGITIVSGMAYGIDSFAHYACIEKNKPTIGVLACGLNIEYPERSFELRRKICENGGAVISELMPSAPVDRSYFRARNRLMAWLSEGTAVFQADEKSGSLITASYAAEENREVFCVPPPDIFDSRYTGVVPFLRDGAIPVFNHRDILEHYFPGEYL